jgi:hypothetical protein
MWIKYFLLFSITLSCNVMEMTGIAETDLGDNFKKDLTLGLDFFAKLDSSGDQYSQFGDILLVNNFTVTQTTGVNGGAIQCDSAGTANADGALKDTTTSIIYGSADSFAISFWIKMDVIYGAAVFGTVLTDGGTITIQLGDDDAQADSNDLKLNVNGMVSNYVDFIGNTGEWNHVAINFVNGGDERYVYLNGNFYTSTNSHTQMNVNASGLSLCSNFNGGNELAGAIDSVGIWRRLLDDEDIRALYNGNNNVD